MERRPAARRPEESVLKSILAALAAWIVGVISAGGPAGVVALMAIESACIPLPSEIIMPFAGYLVAKGAMNFHAAALAGALGCAVGSAMAYGIGAWGGRPFIEKYGRFVLLREKDVDRAEAWFRRYGDAAIFWSRLLPVVRTFISLPAGIARMPFGKFLLLSFLGSVPWCYFLVWVGEVLGRHADSFEAVHARITGYFHGADAVIGVALVVLFVLWLRHHLKDDEPAAEKAGAKSGK
jgi:membrane protein DedA with SNARE-associated domain